jgi:hypothetical protein
MTVKEASSELFSQLKENDGIMGTGVRKSGSTSYIVVYLEKAKKALLNKIPHEFQGNQVKTEVSGRFTI